MPQTAHAHPLIQFWENRTGSHEGLLLEPRLSFYSTTANDGNDSLKTALPNGISVSRTYLDLNLTYGFSEDFFVFGRLSALSTTINNYPNVPNYSASGLSDQLVGFAYRIYSTEGGFSMNIQGEVTLPTYSNNIADAKPFLGDGSTDITGGAFLEIPLPTLSRDFYLETGAGYTFRSKGYSATVPWSVLLKREPLQNGFIFALGGRGTYSLETDKTSASVATSDTTIGGGGSDLINAINPSWVVLQGSAGYKTLSGQSYYALLAAPLTEKNAPVGLQISLGVRFDFGPRDHSIQSDEPATSKKSRPTKATAFSSYDLEGTVISINDQLHLLKIDKGIDDGVEKGQYFDIYKTISDASTDQKKEKLYARAKITDVKNNESALSVIEYYVDQWIEKGFIVRRLVK